MSLQEEIKELVGKKRRFFLLRIADVDADTARKLAKVPKGTYNTWTSDPHSHFVELYRRRDEFSGIYKQEAIQILRRDNQLQAVLLEQEIIKEMREEIRKGTYNLIRTNLARDVYTKLIGDLDYQPQVQSLTWVDKLQQLFPNEPVPIGGQRGQIIEAEVSELTEHPESQLVPQGEQGSP